MMDLGRLFVIAVGVIFVNNFVLARFLGLCPFMGVSRKLDTAFGMGVAVVFVMSLASMVTWLIQNYILIPFHIEYLRTVTFILVIATLVQLVEMFLQKAVPVLYRALGIYLPLITTNCAVLGVCILNIDKKMNFLESIIQGASAGIGFTLVLLLMSGIRERLDLADIPESLKGLPIAFITAALLGIAFLGFSGMITE